SWTTRVVFSRSCQGLRSLREAIASGIRLIGAAIQEARRDERVHDGLAGAGVDPPQPSHLPRCQGEAWHFEILPAYAVDPLRERFLTGRHFKHSQPPSVHTAVR